MDSKCCDDSCRLNFIDDNRGFSLRGIYESRDFYFRLSKKNKK